MVSNFSCFQSRHSVKFGFSLRNTRENSNYYTNDVSPVAAAAQAAYANNPIAEIAATDFKVMGGLTFAGVNGNPRGMWNGVKGNFMPRIGLAYQLTPQTILRAGYGIFYDSIGINGYNSIQTGFSTSTPVQASIDSGLTFVASTANPYNQRWSFSVQRVLPGGLKSEVTYVGNRGTRLQVGRSMNVTPAKYLSKSLSRDNSTINYLAQVYPNPFYGTNSIYTKNTSRAALLLPYPQFGGVSATEPIGYSWYHALQAGVEKRFSKGFMLMFNYTYSRAMDATAFLNASDSMPYESISTADRPHRVVASGIWELPFGRGRRFGPNMPSAVNFFAGGWQLNGVMQRQSGAPLEWGDVWTLFSGDSTKVGLSKDKRSVDRWFNTDAGFNKVSNQQLASNVRYSPWRFSNLRADGQARWDFSVFKNFLIMEKVTAQFRAESVNAFNHPNLMTPVMTPTSSTFGMITSQDATRTWVMSLKLSF